MRTIIHLSDLHFGRVDPGVLEPLRRRVHALNPDLVVVSGDLTQRARPEQFRQARGFLDSLPSPRIVVPGNHDVPLYNLFQRFFQPLRKFRRFITDDPHPCHIDDEIAVVGLNTARSLTFKDGRVSEEQVGHVHDLLAGVPGSAMKIVVTHHPFDVPETEDQGEIVGRARMALEGFARCGADILLSGHLHVSNAVETGTRYRLEGWSALVVQAGTATSTRTRGETNSFNVLHIDGGRVSIVRHRWDEPSGDFVEDKVEAYVRAGRDWAPVTHHGG
jgi:3',5'-cyclic AMP phosphodiesterase CpdA